MHESNVDWIFKGPACLVLIINLVFLFSIMWVSVDIKTEFSLNKCQLDNQNYVSAFSPRPAGAHNEITVRQHGWNEAVQKSIESSFSPHTIVWFDLFNCTLRAGRGHWKKDFRLRSGAPVEHAGEEMGRNWGETDTEATSTTLNILGLSRGHTNSRSGGCHAEVEHLFLTTKHFSNII